MRHMILAPNAEAMQRVTRHLEAMQTEMRRVPMELRITAQLKGIHNVHLHIVAGWEAGFTMDGARRMMHIIHLMEKTKRLTLRHYSADCNPSKKVANMRGELKAWRSHKVVRAGKIQTVERLEEKGQYMVRITTTCGVVIDENSKTWLERLPSQMLGGYYVLYEDGYSSWSPARAFEEGNSPLHQAVPAAIVPAPLPVAIQQGPILYVTEDSKILRGREVRGILHDLGSALHGCEFVYRVDTVALTDSGLVIHTTNDGGTYEVKRLTTLEYASKLVHAAEEPRKL